MIDRRQFLAGLAGTAAAQPRRPNVLFLAVDDLRPQLGCYGDRFARTPNIDALARGGALFERAYCQQALCGPTRASLLTGLRPDTIRVYDLQTRFRDAVPDAVTLPQLFKQNGYVTESIGKIFHGSEIMSDPVSWSAPERLNIVNKRDQYALPANRDSNDESRKIASTELADVPDDAYIDGRIAADAVRTLGRIKDKPFFLAVGFNKPHLPFAAPKKYWDLFDRREFPLPAHPNRPANMPAPAITAYSELRSYEDVPDTGPISEAKIREALHGYYAATAYTDANVGNVLSALRASGVEDNTIVVLWGDHGWHLGEQDYWGKTTNFEVCTRVPLIVRTPGRPAATVPALVEFVDIYPSLAELCSLSPPRNLEGLSFVPLLRAPKTAWKRAVFSQYPRREAGGEKLMGYSMRTNHYRYTEWLAGDRALRANELYDYRRVVADTANVAAKPENRELVRTLSGLLKEGWRAALPGSRGQNL